MTDKIIINFLTFLGLTEIESKVFLTLLQNGPQSELTLSRQTKVPRTTVYRVLENLNKKGILQKNTFPTTNSLEKLLTSKEIEIKNLRDQLPSILKLLDYYSPIQ